MFFIFLYFFCLLYCITKALTDKIEKYKALLQKVIPIIKNSTNQMEKRAGYDFNILLKAAINETNNAVFMYLNDAIEHLLRYFAKNLDDFLSGKEDWENLSKEIIKIYSDIFHYPRFVEVLFEDFLLSPRRDGMQNDYNCSPGEQCRALNSKLL